MSFEKHSTHLDRESQFSSLRKINIENNRLSRPQSNNSSRCSIENYLSNQNNISSFNDNSNASNKKKTDTLEPFNDKLSFWILYCYIVTFWAISPLLKLCGIDKKEQQKLWREKIGLLVIIFVLGTFVSYLTLGLVKTTCSFQNLKLNVNNLGLSYIAIHGRAFKYKPTYMSINNDKIIIDLEERSLIGPASFGGMDFSFEYQNINGHCANLITSRNKNTESDESILNFPLTYFPCNPYDHSNLIIEEENCHLDDLQKSKLFELFPYSSVIVYTWEQLKNKTNQRLVVYNGNVMDLALLKFFQKDKFEYPPVIQELANSDLFNGYDISLLFTSTRDKQIARCLVNLIKVGEIDSDTIGCLMSTVILYLSLTLILSIVIFKFITACYFRWFVSKKQGAFQLDNKSFIAYINKIEEWSTNMTAQAPLKKVDPHLRPKQPKEKQYANFKRKSSITNSFLKRSSQFYTSNSTPSFPNLPKIEEFMPIDKFNGLTTMPIQTIFQKFRSVHQKNDGFNKTTTTFTDFASPQRIYDSPKILSRSIVHENVVEQPPITYMPDNFPLIHIICFVTCYSEDEDGIRVTLDSISTSDYPNSHKLLFIVCDGLIKGSGSNMYTSDIILSMMNDYVRLPESVEASSYISIASGSKQHNMGKVYAGFYNYNDLTVPREKQQRVPIILVVKCGTPLEQLGSKAGNRGKRDSQVILMSFLKKILLNDRMTDLEYMLLKNIWQLTGLMADQYEAVLMIDADTKIFPDSLTHMAAELVKDPLIMGLCGETKIANKTESWVTAIQVFEYYISHHQIKAFESVFGSVTCLPGCFSIYRIKSPKGNNGKWVPILVNPEIVERYSDNDTRSLHKKNLLLLGEDRYLSSLMLKTFPKRKQIFVNKAACKTIVPSEFGILLSQRRRWINSTIHNLFELVLVQNLCGTFFFSMQFVVIIELIGTLVLPLAICLTGYLIFFSIFSSPTPVLALVLLAVILGLPGILVVVTSTKWIYIIWMLIYLLALPIWNLVLPSYAYWKFDDFSWGKTRAIAENNLDPKSKEIDDMITPQLRLRRWEDFEKNLVEVDNV
ncbi:hypothetical protein RI543_003252 [Arxiozyma heterogenica]|uniref:chitin synthase n=1 Tax=Arxiozyma heterogenica TaxID=278026 RepID=A0AAN7W1X0_9SACH|nr:hypothetical protein RI543_003252 [Kazachstania heterogenica]